MEVCTQHIIGGRRAAQRAVRSSHYDLLPRNCEHLARQMDGDGDRSYQVAGAGTGAATVGWRRQRSAA
eukprot:6170793-Amphidinium_carterae.1